MQQILSSQETRDEETSHREQQVKEQLIKTRDLALFPRQTFKDGISEELIDLICNTLLFLTPQCDFHSLVFFYL